MASFWNETPMKVKAESDRDDTTHKRRNRDEDDNREVDEENNVRDRDSDEHSSDESTSDEMDGVSRPRGAKVRRTDARDRDDLDALMDSVIVYSDSSVDRWQQSCAVYERVCCGDRAAREALIALGGASNEAKVFFALYVFRSESRPVSPRIVEWLSYHVDRLSTAAEEAALAAFFHAALGVFHLKGLGGLAADRAAAMRHLQLARVSPTGGGGGSDGDFVAPFAAHYLAACLSEGDEGDADVEEAFRLFTWAAAPPRSYVFSQARLARAYEIGQGVGKDVSLAMAWHRAAAGQGYVASQYELGRILHSKKLPEQRDGPLEEALHWFRQAAKENERGEYAGDDGEAKAQVMLGYYYEHGLGGVSVDERRALYWYLQAARQGEATGQQNVGVCYERGFGLPGAEPNYALAAKFFGRAARQGLLSAVYRRGYGYHYGRGVSQNFRKAAHWYRIGYLRGHAEATYSLALLYRYGQGVERQDLVEAARLTRLSAQRGSLSGMCYLGVISGRGQGVARDEAAELHWYREAADRGYALAQYYLGNIYLSGSAAIGVAVDLDEALRWFHESAERGESQAQKKLAQCYEQGVGVEPDAELAAYWRRMSLTSSSSSGAVQRQRLQQPPPSAQEEPPRRLLSLRPSAATGGAGDERAQLERQRREEQERRRVEAAVDDLVTAMPSLLSLE